MSKETSWWDGWNTRCRKGEIDAKTAEVRGAVLATLHQLGLSKRQKVLEVGCGTGWLAAELPDKWDYLGLDLSPAAVELASERVPGARFEACDLHEWQEPPAGFDVVVSVDTIAYFRDQDTAVAKISNALRPGGRALMTTVNPFVYSRLSSVGPPGDGQVRKWLTKSQLFALLRRHGLEPVTSWTILPDGNLGILRWVNSRKANQLMAFFVGRRILRAAKETLGLGQYRIVVARKVDDHSG